MPKLPKQPLRQPRQRHKQTIYELFNDLNKPYMDDDMKEQIFTIAYIFIIAIGAIGLILS